MFDLRDGNVPYEVELDYCTFDRAVNLSRAVFAKSISLGHSVFKGPVSLDHAANGGIVDMRNATFTYTKTGSAVFTGMKAGGDTILNGATSYGPVDFRQATIDGLLDGRRAIFQDLVHLVHFDTVTVAGNARFTGALFAGPLTFQTASIGGQLDISSITAESQVNLRSAVVKSDTYANESHVRGWLDNYGHDPEQLLPILTVLVLGGILEFRRRYLKSDDSKAEYNAL